MSVNYQLKAPVVIEVSIITVISYEKSKPLETYID